LFRIFFLDSMAYGIERAGRYGIVPGTGSVHAGSLANASDAIPRRLAHETPRNRNTFLNILSSVDRNPGSAICVRLLSRRLTALETARHSKERETLLPRPATVRRSSG